MAEKTYKNISGAPVLGNAPGKVFTADIPDAQLKRMIARHSIEEVDPSKQITEVKEGEEFSEAGTPEEPKSPDGEGGTSGDGKDNEGGGQKQPEPKPPFGKKGS